MFEGFYTNVCFYFQILIFIWVIGKLTSIYAIDSNCIKVIEEFCVDMHNSSWYSVALYIVRQSTVPTLVFVIFLKCEYVVRLVYMVAKHTYYRQRSMCGNMNLEFYAATFTTASLCVFMTTQILHNIVIRCSIAGICFTFICFALCYKV